MIRLNWMKCGSNFSWCNFDQLNLEADYFVETQRIGVYVIWHGGAQPKTVYVGQGVVKDRLSVHRRNYSITKYSGYGLFVTWAEVPSVYLDGVEAFLAASLNPLEGERHPDVTFERVNLPWD